jgi:hypothetical protein
MFMIRSKVVQFSVLAGFSAIVLSSLSFESAFRLDHYSTQGDSLCYEVPHRSGAGESMAVAQPAPYLGKSFAGFKEAVGFKESGGDYQVINDFGYLGKYQFGPSTLRLIGIHSPEQFMNDPSLQEAAFEVYAARNKWVLRRELKKYVGKEINGIKITESGVLAAAHLAGPGNVKKYLRSGGSRSFKDAFGTSIGFYLKRFSGYDTSVIPADKEARVF